MTFKWKVSILTSNFCRKCYGHPNVLWLLIRQQVCPKLQQQLLLNIVEGCKGLSQNNVADGRVHFSSDNHIVCAALLLHFDTTIAQPKPNDTARSVGCSWRNVVAEPNPGNRLRPRTHQPVVDDRLVLHDCKRRLVHGRIVLHRLVLYQHHLLRQQYYPHWKCWWRINKGVKKILLLFYSWLNS